MDSYRSWLRATAGSLYRYDLEFDADELARQVEARLDATGEDVGADDASASHLHRVVGAATIDVLRDAQANQIQTGQLRTTPALSPDVMAHIKAVVVGLPPEHQVAGALHLEGFSRAEIAQLTGWSDDETRQRVHGALKALRDSLAALGIEYAAD